MNLSEFTPDIKHFETRFVNVCAFWSIGQDYIVCCVKCTCTFDAPSNLFEVFI